jgi:hypothetical protein
MMASCYHRKCDRTFGGLTGFDRHLQWLDGPPWIMCKDPSTVGLTLSADGTWIQGRGGFAGVITPAGGQIVSKARGNMKEGHRG